MLNRSALKQQAKEINKAAKVNVYSFTLLYLLLTAALTALDTFVTGGQLQTLLDMYTELGFEVPFTIPTLPMPAASAVFVGVIATLLTSVLSVGHSLYHLGIRRQKHMDYMTLFDGFTFVGKVILLALVQTALITLWSMLFFFPGIIAQYRYRFAFYNLCSDPRMGVMEAIRLSCRQTRGYKMQLFILDLSFLGWALLTALTAGILSIWYIPYYTQTDVGAYYAICQAQGILIPGSDLPPYEDTPNF